MLIVNSDNILQRLIIYIYDYMYGNVVDLFRIVVLCFPAFIYDF